MGYDYINVPAKKTESRGRASGGIILLFKKSLNFQIRVIQCRDWWLSVCVESNIVKIVLCAVYLRPGKEFDYLLDSVKNDLHEIGSAFPNYNLILAGDFNSRIGQLNVLDDEVFAGYDFNGLRVSKDNITNTRGNKLIEIIEQLGVFILNGRTLGDSVGNYTYLGNNGCSVIDLVCASFCSLSLIKDLNIINISNLSDHFACELRLYSGPYADSSSCIQTNPTARVLRDQYHLSKFVECLRQNNGFYFNSDNVDELYLNYIDTITNCMNEANIIKKISNSAKYINKPWFTRECNLARKKVNLCLKLCRKNNFSSPSLKHYLKHKKSYKALLKSSKKNYFEKIKSTFRNIKDSCEFWNTVNRFRKKTF